MGIIAPQDAGFMIAESREHPMHVAGLQLYQLPPDAGSNYVSHFYQELLKFDTLRPLFRKRPQDPVSSIGQLWWTEDDEVDLEYHVRLTALPTPRKVRQLLELTSRLHSGLLDRHRPLWEFYLIEGVEGDRFATYTKIHHALVDGVAATRLFARALSEDPAATSRPFWAAREGGRPSTEPKRKQAGTGLGAALGSLKSAASTVRDLAGTAPSMAKLATDALRGQIDGVPLPPPKTILNVPITGARRFAAQSWDIDRLKKAGQANGATMNDMVLAMCAGALRRYLREQDALPEKPLVGCVPVSLALRSGAGGGDGGNAVGAVLCNLGTNIADPHRRLETIVTSMRTAKETLAGQSAMQIQAQAILLLGAGTVLNAIPGAASTLSPPFNVIISNVPGPKNPLYWNGARMEGTYPVSIPTEGQALNITVTSYAGEMHFGLIGCRRRVPHLQRMLGHLEDSLVELET